MGIGKPKSPAGKIRSGQEGKMCRPRIVVLCPVSVVAAFGWMVMTGPNTAAQSSSITAAVEPARQRFAGTWRLVGIERIGPNGELLPPPAPPAFGSPNATGIIIYDPDGYMAVTILQRGRQKYAGRQPTPREALAAFASYTAYFGTFGVDEADRVVTHHVQGSLNPNNTGSHEQQSFEFSGNRLILRLRRGRSDSQFQLTWER